jgi:hypothetical protein
MLYIAICFTLFALMGGVLLLSKARTDAMGNLAKWIAWLVILTSVGMFICEIGQACVRMAHCGGPKTIEKHILMRGGEDCGPGMGGCMMGGMNGGRMGHGGMMWHGRGECNMEDCREMMERCEQHKECCEGMGKDNMDEACGMHMKKMRADSTK